MTAVGGARRGMSPSGMLDDASTPSATSPPRRLLANTGSCRAQNPEPNPFLKSPTEKKLASAPKVMHHHGARHLLPDALFQPVLMPVQTVARSSDVHRTAGLAPLPRIPSPRQPGPPHGYAGVSVDPRVRSDILGEGSSISPRSASMSSRAAPVHRPRSPELVHAPAARTNGVPAPLADQTSAHRTVPSVGSQLVAGTVDDKAVTSERKLYGADGCRRGGERSSADLDETPTSVVAATVIRSLLSSLAMDPQISSLQKKCVSQALNPTNGESQSDMQSVRKTRQTKSVSLCP